MDSIVYQALISYFNVLEKTGYIAFSKVQKLLVLCFYRDFVFQDYRGILTKEDYHLIEQALDCLYGSTCLIPYPDYLKMGKLHLGEITELSQRVKNLEETEVIKVLDGTSVDSDIMIVEEDTPTPEPTPTPTPEPTPQTYKTYQMEHIVAMNDEIDDDCYIIPFDDLITLFEERGNGTLTFNAENQHELRCAWYDAEDEDLTHAQWITNFGSSEQEGICALTMPYTLTQNDIDSLENTAAEAAEHTSSLSLILVDYVGSVESTNLCLTYTES